MQTAWHLKSTGKIDFEWQVAGIQGREEILVIIEKTLKLKFVDNNIKFKGLVHSEELVSCLLNSNCYVHPSHIENSPNSVCEAMILGLPVIATYAGGTPSILLNKVEGLLVQDGDPYALAGSILELLGSSEKMEKYSEKAREKALLRHDPSRILGEIINIYKTIIN